MRLDGKVILLTGARGGLGSVVMPILSGEGATIMIEVETKGSGMFLRCVASRKVSVALSFFMKRHLPPTKK